MSASVPASLKQADLARFVLRAGQLEKARPVVSYWCNYWVVNQILSKGLQNADEESLAFTMALMDKLEQFKSQNTTNDAIIDDVAGKAYVEQFGLETFVRADNAVRANKASRQTGDTFQAAAAFLELLSIWGPIDAENHSKIKYAKFHALRIARAIKAGEDPNLSNPKQEPEPVEILPELDPNDAEVQALQGNVIKPRQPSVVDAPDEADTLQANLARTSSLDQSLHPSRDPSAVRQRQQPAFLDALDDLDDQNYRSARQSTHDESLQPSRAASVPRLQTDATSSNASHDVTPFHTGVAQEQPDISPIEPESHRKPSIGGNYFPVTSVPDQLAPGQAPSERPTAPTPNTAAAASLGRGPAPSQSPLGQVPATFQPQPLPPTTGLISPSNIPSNVPAPEGQPVPPFLTNQSQPNSSNLLPQPSSIHLHPQLPPQPPQQPLDGAAIIPPAASTLSAPSAAPHPTSVAFQPQTREVVDEEAMMRAQKHARWAISALNFEDVPTAVRELQGALAVLGAR